MNVTIFLLLQQSFVITLMVYDWWPYSQLIVAQLLHKQMFPQIGKKKKKEFVMEDNVYKEWEDTSKQLDVRSKLVIKKLPNAVLHDYSKVCRIKSIPEFYANYFICYSYKNSEERLPGIFSEQIENILTHRSHFHKINKVLQARDGILGSIRDSLLVVEGFVLMSQGKNIPLISKGTIQDLVKGCQSLEQLKELEKRKTEELVKNIIKVRENTVDLIKEVASWRKELQELGKGQSSVLKKIRIIYPHCAVNCLLLPFHDLLFLKNSTLKTEINFGRQEDPFLQRIAKNKKGSQIQTYFCDYLKNDTTDYRQYVALLKDQIPKDEAEELKAKQIQQEMIRQREQKYKEDKIKQQKVKEQKLKEQKMKEDKLKEMRTLREKEKKVRIERYSSLNNLKAKKDQELGRGASYKSSRGERSVKKIINIDALLQQTVNKRTGAKQLPSKDDLKIIGVYQKGKKIRSNMLESRIHSDREQDVVQEKRVWEKQIKEEQLQKEKIKRLLKQTEKKALIETRQFQQKLKKYEQEVANLRSKVDSNKRDKRAIISSQKIRSPSKNKKSVASVYGSAVKQPMKGSGVELLESKLEQESRIKKNLQQQIKQLAHQKEKIQKMRDKESSKISKESEVYKKKIEKYEQVINKLKQESEENKRLIKNLESSKISEQKKVSQNLRMYTIKQKEENLKKRIEQKMQMREERKKLKQLKFQEEIKRRKQKSQINKSSSRIQKSIIQNIEKDLQIVKTKQTIEIVFESRGSRKKKEPVSKQSLQVQSRLMRLQKQRQMLERKLEMSQVVKEDHKKQLENKMNEKEQRVDFYKNQVQKERDRNVRLEQNLKLMRKSINNQYQSRINMERIRFQRERQELLKAIQKQKEQKQSKDRFLEQQMKLLKQMQKNEYELMNLLQKQKRQKQSKERILAEQLQKKEQLKNLIEIEQIKKSIEREVRRQLLDSDSSDEQQTLLVDRKIKIEQEIDNLRAERNQQIQQLDQQNDKLKDLIARIKGQQNKLLQVIKQNIQLQSEEEKSIIKNSSQISSKSKNVQNQQKPEPTDKKSQLEDNYIGSNEQLVKQLQDKTLLQFRSQEKKRTQYAVIQNSSNYKDKQKIENLVQFYLRSPHQYPGEKDITLKKQEQQLMVQDLQHRAKLIQKFQHQLFSSKKLPDFVPTINNDTINNHLLNLRQVYQEYQADALRRELFPPLKQDQVYNERQLSVQSEEAPIVTIMDDVNAHQKKYPSRKTEDKKNFLAINRMRLMLLEEGKKKKQREMIEEESRRKIQRENFERNRKKRQDQIRKKKQEQQLQREQKQEQFEKSIVLLQREKKKKYQRQKRKREERRKSQRSEHSEGKKKQFSDSQRSSSRSTHKLTANRSKKYQSQRQMSESQPQKSKQIQIASQRIIEQKKNHPQVKGIQNSQQNEKDNIKDTKRENQEERQRIEAIEEEQMEQSLDHKEQAELQKIERQMLRDEIKQLQSEIRQFISNQEQYLVYQQFVSEEETETFVDKLMELSSDEIKHLNGNNTLKQDLKLYCTVNVLVAKDEKGIEVGMGIFHKQYASEQYVCDYIMAHKMTEFLTLIFNFSKFIYASDPLAQKIQFFFDLQYIQDQETLSHFVEFQKKCRRMGEVYVKAKNSKERKYVLKRTLFFDKEVASSNGSKGFQVDLKLLLFDDFMREINEGFKNLDNINFSSLNLILAYYLSKNPQKLTKFRQKTQTDLNYRELLITALLFQKKELQIKNFKLSVLSEQLLLPEINAIGQNFDASEVQQIGQTAMGLSEKLPAGIKRCVLQVQSQQTAYLVYKPEEAVTRIQSSNSSETGVFLSLIPKYKILIIQAEQFLSMSEKNSELTAFFYIKHFIKNIVDVKKELYQRVYFPEMVGDSYCYLKELSVKMGGSMFLEEKVRIGWQQSFGNSIIFTPKHRDLVIQKPFILAVLSGAVERAVEGSPIFVRVIM